MNYDKLKIKGIVTLNHYDKNGNLLHTLKNHNLIVDTGLEFFIKKISDIPIDAEMGNQIGYIGIGNGEAPARGNQTGLTLSAAQISIASEHITEYKHIRYKRSINNNLILETTFVDGEYSNETVVEVGLFTNVLDTYDIPVTMIARTLIEIENRFQKADSDYLSVSWNIQFGD
jgi:hypothetical protein